VITKPSGHAAVQVHVLHIKKNHCPRQENVVTLSVRQLCMMVYRTQNMDVVVGGEGRATTLEHSFDN
jgi:hypothetical protein